MDHEIAEVWDEDERRWWLVDPEVGAPLVGDPFDVTDVPRDRFLVGGLAWRMCREGRADPEGFVVDPELEIEQIRGWPYVCHNLIHGLAALNKAEMILWDYRGMMEREPSDEELALLDGVAGLTQAGNEAFPRLRAIYEEGPDLKAPSVVKSYSPATDAPREVRLSLYSCVSRRTR